MSNPINNTVFDSRELITYKESLESDLLGFFNDYLEDHNREVDEEDEKELINDFDEVDFNLEGFAERFEDEISEYEKIKEFCDELENNCIDFTYGASIIHEKYFTEYAEQLCEDIGDIPKDLPSYISSNINWENVADDLKVDYSTVSYDGNDYYVR